jgi:uridylate kinase
MLKSGALPDLLSARNMSGPELPYKRILLKLSGESLAGPEKYGLSADILSYFVTEVKDALVTGVQVGIVIGGGNFYRGISSGKHKLSRTTGDQMGMLATVINTLALRDVFASAGIPVEAMSAAEMPRFIELFSARNAITYLNSGKVVIFGAGTANPFFTTDTAAVLKALEIESDVILKGTRVDGVFSADPERDKKAVLFTKLTYEEVLEKNLKVMDMASIALARDENLPIIVFNFDTPGNLKKVIEGGNIGTKVQR